jgi:hypothetical protein
MTLYSADVLDIAKPIPKKGKGKKNVEKENSSVEVEETKPEIKAAPVKKPPTEKQLAALAKAQESRKRKREEAEKAKQDLIDAEKKKEEKKQEVKEKRKSKKMPKLATPPPSLDEEIDRAVEDLHVKPAPPKRDDNEPPSWFKQYIAGVKKEEAKISREKKPKKQIQQEAVEVAHKNWNDSFTRDRVRNEVDGHMSRMYQMMFAGRRMK